MIHNPEYCAKVAEAVGLEVAWFDGGTCYVAIPLKETGDTTRPFRPDVDLNDTFWAAELVGLWGNMHNGDGPFVLSGRQIRDLLRSGPRAICDAILALKTR